MMFYPFSVPVTFCYLKILPTWMNSIMEFSVVYLPVCCIGCSCLTLIVNGQE